MTLTDESTTPATSALKPGAPTAPPPVAFPRKRNWGLIVTAVMAVAGIGATALYMNRGTSTAGGLLTYTAQIDTFDVRIPLNGELKASRNVELRNQVEGQTTILSIVPEGKWVKEGEVVVTLASDAIKDKLEESRIRLDNAVAATVNAEEMLHIQEMQNESDIKGAEINAEVANLEFDQFDKGDSKVQIDTLSTALENANTDLERKAKDLARVKELAKKQFVSDNDVLDAVIAERDSRNKLATAEMNLKVWKEYTEPKQRQTLQRKRDESARELERVKSRTKANLLLKQADQRARQSTQRVEESRFKALQAQLEACSMKAPQEGMVVYQSSMGGGQNQNGPIEEGMRVWQNQVLIQLPDTSKMMVEMRLPETLTDRVRQGQQAVITVDAVPGKAFRGKVETIAVLPDGSNRWANPNLKEYLTTVMLDEQLPALKPGMSAKVEVLVERLSDVMAVPLQAVFNSGGESYVYVGHGDTYERRTVVPGLSSATKIEIKQGLEPGEAVLLSRPKDAPADQEMPRKKDDKENGKKRNSGNGGAAAAAAATPGRSKG